MDDREAAKQRESETAKQRDSEWESEQESKEEDEEESWIDMLVQGIIEPNNYRKRQENIMNFLREYLNVKIFNMEHSFQKTKEQGGKVKKEDKKKYEELKKAIKLLDEHNDTMIHLMNKAEQNEEMDITSGEDVEVDDDDDDDMEVDFMSIGEKRRGGRA
jgi:D-lyxose ketol-isomerase